MAPLGFAGSTQLSGVTFSCATFLATFAAVLLMRSLRVVRACCFRGEMMSREVEPTGGLLLLCWSREEAFCEEFRAVLSTTAVAPSWSGTGVCCALGIGVSVKSRVFAEMRSVESK